MTIEAKVIEDSVSKLGVRLITLQLCYPRFIHAEFMTHRVFSRNASSSRAIPVAKMLAQVRDNPAMPIHWGANEPGMQARAELSGEAREKAISAWRTAATLAAKTAESMMECGLHKQVANRILEPFQHIHVIMTSTEWDNFFELRDHPAAQPEMQALARAMRGAINTSTPRTVQAGEWHLPYVTADERNDAFWLERQLGLAAISAARCARVSYMNHDGTLPNIERDRELARTLFSSRHMSPFEHAAKPLGLPNSFCNNLRGWRPLRWMIERRPSEEL